MPSLQSKVLDYGLTVLDTQATHIYICNTEPTTYTQATSTYALGNKNFGAGSVFSAPTDGTPNGRKVASVAITDGSITANGTAAFWAVVDSGNSALLATGNLNSSQVVTNGNQFTLNSFEIRIPSV